MIVVTGAAGFIGSNFVRHLNHYGYTDLILVDFDETANLLCRLDLQYLEFVPADVFFEWAGKYASQVDFVVHLGAQTDKDINDYAVFKKWNVEYSQRIWSWASQNHIPLIYASSAETYGEGMTSCIDDDKALYKLKPVSLCGRSKHEFDQWVLKQVSMPPFWYGLKFFNVFGPNEGQKLKNASLVYQLVRQIMTKQIATLPLVGGQEPLYDFVYVTDVTTVMMWFMNHFPARGLYNVGTAYARPLSVAAQSVFSTLKIQPQVEFSENMTCPVLPSAGLYADLSKLRKVNYKKSFLSLETSVRRLVKASLSKENC